MMSIYISTAFSFFFSTFEFEQLIVELRSCQMMDAVRYWVLVMQRLIAGVDDGCAVQQSHVPEADGTKNKKVTNPFIFNITIKIKTLLQHHPMAIVCLLKAYCEPTLQSPTISYFI